MANWYCKLWFLLSYYVQYLAESLYDADTLEKLYSHTLEWRFMIDYKSRTTTVLAIKGEWYSTN